jgi:hypothetical protein
MFADMHAPEPPKPVEPLPAKRSWAQLRAAKAPIPAVIMPMGAGNPGWWTPAGAKAKLAPKWRRLRGVVASAAAATTRWVRRTGIVASAVAVMGLILAAVVAAVWIGIEAVRGP